MEEIEEPYRKSLLDVIDQNFTFSKRRTYLHRLIYTGAHKCNVVEECIQINEIFESIVSKINVAYVDEKLSGILLYYPAYFCHVIEGSEESLVRHVRLLLENPETADLIETPKVLTVYHHLNQRFFEDWVSFSAKPPTLLEDIDVTSDCETASRQVCNCIRKLYGLCTTLREKLKREFDFDSGAPSEDSICITTATPSGITTNVVGCGRMKLTEFLPEYNLLNFLLKTPHTSPLQDYLDSYGLVKPYYNRDDKIWPTPFITVPFNVFDKFVDPIPDLPPRDNVDYASIETPSVGGATDVEVDVETVQLSELAE